MTTLGLRTTLVACALAGSLAACSGASQQPVPATPPQGIDSPTQHVTAAVRAGQRQSFSTYSVIHAFSGGTDGSSPAAGLTVDAAGDLYGTTFAGGTWGEGTVFELKPVGSGWELSSLYSFPEFPACPEGCLPESRVVFGPDGNLYGTTEVGGTYGGGTIYRLTPPVRQCVTHCPWSFTVLHQLNSQTEGQSAVGDLTFDAAGNIYGAAAEGGTHGGGIIWELMPSGAFSILYNFGSFGSRDGNWPAGGVIFGSDRSLYGATVFGGRYNNGLVFKLSKSGTGWRERRLYDIQNGYQIENPRSGLVFDASGDLFGSTASNGGTLFKLAPARRHWAYSLLQTLTGTTGPVDAALVSDSTGDMFGTTQRDGASAHGNVFELTGGSRYADLYDFTDGNDGAFPNGSITVTPNAIYGTASEGGANGYGVVFEMTSSSRLNRHQRQTK